MNYYLSRKYRNYSSAGNKARTDIEKVMQGMGIKNIGLPTSTYSNSVVGFVLNLLNILKAVITLSKGDNIVLQYPIKKYFSFICKSAHLRGAKVIVVIHDLGSFRRKRVTSKAEIKRLNNADYIISHNNKMKAWLLENGCTAKLGVLEIFDYLSNTKQSSSYEHKSPYSLVFAGGLSKKKSNFLYDIGDHLKTVGFVLYGNGFNIEAASGKEHFTYEGFKSSDELIESVKGDFGLVWDGDSLDKCSGNFGEYLKINNPHKTSLYIRCGLPIVIWETAALAEFVKSNNIGITINSLTEIEDRISSITDEEYSLMRKNIDIVKNNLANGYYIKKALYNAFQEIK